MNTKLLACAAAIAVAAVPAATLAQGKDWNFGDGTSPERWSTINTDYAKCDMGHMQSPIDLTDPDARGTVMLDTDFGTANGTLAIGEEKVQIDFSAGQGHGMNSGGQAFNLIQVHFHTPSEHAVNGTRYPLVAHFVHATDAGKLGVLGVMFAEGAANPGLAALLDAHSRGNGTALSVDIEDMIPDTVEVYRYMGSLTTPPCSEGVNWHVADRPVTASADQIAKLSAALGPSARSIQPRNGRLLVAPN